jgi:hypothetical protein
VVEPSANNSNTATSAQSTPVDEYLAQSCLPERHERLGLSASFTAGELKAAYASRNEAFLAEMDAIKGNTTEEARARKRELESANRAIIEATRILHQQIYLPLVEKADDPRTIVLEGRATFEEVFKEMVFFLHPDRANAVHSADRLWAAFVKLSAATKEEEEEAKAEERSYEDALVRYYKESGWHSELHSEDPDSLMFQRAFARAISEMFRDSYSFSKIKRCLQDILKYDLTVAREHLASDEVAQVAIRDQLLRAIDSDVARDDVRFFDSVLFSKSHRASLFAEIGARIVDEQRSDLENAALLERLRWCRLSLNEYFADTETVQPAIKKRFLRSIVSGADAVIVQAYGSVPIGDEILKRDELVEAIATRIRVSRSVDCSIITNFKCGIAGADYLAGFKRALAQTSDLRDRAHLLLAGQANGVHGDRDTLREFCNDTIPAYAEQLAATEQISNDELCLFLGRAQYPIEAIRSNPTLRENLVRRRSTANRKDAQILDIYIDSPANRLLEEFTKSGKLAMEIGVLIARSKGGVPDLERAQYLTSATIAFMRRLIDSTNDSTMSSDALLVYIEHLTDMRTHVTQFQFDAETQTALATMEAELKDSLPEVAQRLARLLRPAESKRGWRWLATVKNLFTP